MKPKDDNFGPQNGYRREYPSVESYAASIIKVITLRRRGSAPLGFSIRGGWEHGTGVFVSEVMPGSIAQKQGLRVGDQIVRINGFSIHRAIHMEVLSLLKTCPGIVLKIKRVGILPIKEREKDPVTWKMVESPTPIVCSEQAPHSRVNGSSLENIIVKAEIHVPGSSSLGCSIAKGPPELPGIFMCTVKAGGIAERAGLEVGDQILEMNGTTFHSDIQLAEAVSLMKSSKDIRLTIKKLAGISLFLDNSSCRNRNEDCISTSRSISDGMSSTIKDNEFSGSCSSKSEGSSFQSSVSSDSEKDYSLSEESAFNGLSSKSSSSKWHKHHRKNPSTSTTEDDSWILEERRHLEESRRQLEEEKRRLEEEKRKLELEKSSSSSSSSQMTSLEDNGAVRDNPFLSELQKAAARMNTRENRTAEPGKNGVRNAENGKSKKHKEDAIKRMQHEMLMEEFREAHRKMFGSQPVLSIQEKVEEKESPGEEFSRMTIRNKKPPPPPPKATASESSKECQKITVNGQVPNGFSQSAVPQSEPSIPRVQEIIKETEKTISTASTQSNGIKITVTDKGPVKGLWATSTTYKSKSGALVEVTPWNTRL